MEARCTCGWSGSMDDDRAGQEVSCPGCLGMLLLPAPPGTAALEAPLPDAPPSFASADPCPGTAPVPAPTDLPSMIARAKGQPENGTVVSRCSAATWICLALLLLGPAGGVLCIVMTRETERGLMFGLPLVLLGVVGLAKVLYDLLKPGAGNRRRPESAVRAYLRALSMQWWEGAEMFLSWSARTGIRATRPDIPLLNITERAVHVGGRSGIVGFWGDFSTAGRRFAGISVGPAQRDGDGALVPVAITVGYDINRAPYGSAARQASGMVRSFVYVRIATQWPVYECGGVWYVLSPVWPAGADIQRVSGW